MGDFKGNCCLVGGGANEPKGHREKRGSGAVNIAAREKILGISTVAAKKKAQRLKGGKRKGPTRGPKTNSEKVPKNMTIFKKAHVRPNT
jgi:hypothetical protein